MTTSRTLFVSYEIHPTNAGGCGVLLHHAADVLLTQGHRVGLLLDIPEDFFTRFIETDRLGFAAPDRLEAWRVDDLCDDFPWTQAQIPCVFQWKSSRFAHALRKLTSRESFTGVEFFEYCGPAYYAFVHRLFDEPAQATPEPRGEPVLFTRLHGSIEVLERFGAGLCRDEGQFRQFALEQHSLWLSEAVLTPTRAYFDRYYKDLYRIEPERAVVSSPPKQPFAQVASRPTADGPFRIVFIGRLFHLKGVDQLVHAAVMLMKARPDLDFSIELIGYDSAETPACATYGEYLRTLIPEPFLPRFHFRGQVSHAGIADILEHSLFGVFPNRIESFCYALHEVYDAGVPVIINDLPAFTDFFSHERNCLVYEGTARGLFLQMLRMIEDEQLRERLTKPYPVAEHPIGDYYAAPFAVRSLHPPALPAQPSIRPLVVVLAQDESIPTVLRALAALTHLDRELLVLRPATSGHEETPCLEETLWWLGKPWHIRDEHGKPVAPSDAVTSNVLVVLHHADNPDPIWLETVLRPLARREDIGFAGTWRRIAGRPEAEDIDLAPELYPFVKGERLPRLAVRTAPNTLLAEVLDPSLGGLGLLGLVWDAVASAGPGVMLDAPLIDTAPEAPAPAHPQHLKALIMRHGKHFAEHLSWIAAFQADRALRAEARISSTGTPDAPSSWPASWPTASPIPVDAKIALADELGGTTLARLAWKKLKSRIRQRLP